MKQSGNTIQNANLQEFIDSAANAIHYGQRQFYTPPNIAEVLCRPLPAIRRNLVADLHFGSGALAAGSRATTALGIDIDSRVRSELKPPKDAKWHVEQADLTRWYGVAAEADLRLPFILINPPFSLQWYADRLTALADSDVEEIAAIYKKHPKHIDSTLASFMIALDRLSRLGEGFMVCNATTARRFFGDPTVEASALGAGHSAVTLRKYIWMWLEIPGMIFDNQMTDFPTGVLYFSRSHGEANWRNKPPHFAAAAAGDALSVERAMMDPAVWKSHLGSRYNYEHEFNVTGITDLFNAVNDEYGTRFKGRTPSWNIRLDEQGRLRTWLTPFQKTSKRIDRQLISNLNALNLKNPVALCVTATSRTALREATECGIWRIQPEVHEAIRLAMLDFEASGAPFYTPSPVQALGWVDEHSSLVCSREGIGDCLPGDVCPISCTVEPTVWKGLKTNLAGNTEDLMYHGKELLVTLTDKSGVKHHFHARKDDEKHAPESRHGKITALHWHIADLIEHFKIPIPQDIVSLHPERYAEHLKTLDALERRASEHMAKAS